ncbi:MAG: hypothetical protein FDZ69_06545 [Deltaproteobacteria bacterium]|nr:MAG: hypothetical protein FDZ69_06545 [Deltaproteobacteria bacterium]
MLKNKRYPMQALLMAENSVMVCGAKTRSGAACKNRPVAGRKRCRMHGGTSPTGGQHWNFKHGFYSKEEKKLRAEKEAIMRMLLKDF